MLSNLPWLYMFPDAYVDLGKLIFLRNSIERYMFNPVLRLYFPGNDWTIQAYILK